VAGCNCGGGKSSTYEVRVPGVGTFGPFDSKAAALAEVSRQGGRGTVVPLS
jgi:hypothetical protein